MRDVREVSVHEEGLSSRIQKSSFDVNLKVRPINSTNKRQRHFSVHGNPVRIFF